MIHKHTGRWFDKGAHQLYLGTEINTPVIPSWFQPYHCYFVCAILESISGLEPSSVVIEPRYLKLVTVLSFCPFILISVLMPLVWLVISLVFSALISVKEERRQGR